MRQPDLSDARIFCDSELVLNLAAVALLPAPVRCPELDKRGHGKYSPAGETAFLTERRREMQVVAPRVRCRRPHT